jgi:hypothetical protein
MDAQADSLSQPAGVTLERCGDVKAEEVQAALAIEYQDEEFGNTMLTVQCRGESATLRIIGPSHPRGRIADIDLQGVEPVARSRTIAVLAAELWTAPEAPLAPSEASAPPSITETVERSAPAPELRSNYRSKLSAGVALVQSSRSFHAGRRNSRVGAQGDFSSLAFRADWPASRWLGLFTEASVSASSRMAGHAELDASVRWRRSEAGMYVPLVRKRFRLDLRFSFGTDTITAQGVYVRNSERTLLPRYDYLSFGVDMAYAINPKTSLVSWITSYDANTTDLDYPELTGRRWGLGLHHQLDAHLQLDARAELASLHETSDNNQLDYTDRAASLALALSYTH